METRFTSSRSKGVGRLKAHPLVRRRPFGVVNHENINKRLTGCHLQSQLVLDGLKKVRRSVRVFCRRRWAIGCPCQAETELSRKPGLVHHWAVENTLS